MASSEAFGLLVMRTYLADVGANPANYGADERAAVDRFLAAEAALLAVIDDVGGGH